MSTQAANGAAPLDPVKSPAVSRQPPGQRANPSPGVEVRKETQPIYGDSVVADLVSRARNGDEQAWDALVIRYAPLIWSICRKHRLPGADAEEVGQSVWLHLVEHLDKVRCPAALPGWLATTTKRECARVLRTPRRAQAARSPADIENIPEEQTRTAEQELLAAERHAALREALMDLPPSGQQLIAMLTVDPPMPYAEIGARLGIPVGSIGPTRARYLDRLRRHPAITALINADSSMACDHDR